MAGIGIGITSDGRGAIGGEIGVAGDGIKGMLVPLIGGLEAIWAVGKNCTELLNGDTRSAARNVGAV